MLRENGGAEGEGVAEYGDACRILQAQHAAVGQPGAAAEALQLVSAVLTGSSGDNAAGSAEWPQADEFLAALTMLRHVREEIAGWEPQLITAAREHGVSWASLAPALGVTSRQAAERRYLRLRPSATGEATGEQRVQAERTKRAGDRAVAQWARQNSASLRQLAGQVSALDGLPTSAQYHAERVQQALADNDPVTLLYPLSEVHAHLSPSHDTLAEQITTITDCIEQLRRDTRERRHPPDR